MKKKSPPNFPFDVAELMDRLIRENPKHVSHMAEFLEIHNWIPRLWLTGAKQEVLAGNMLATVLMSAHSDARNWDRLADLLEFLGDLDVDYELEWVDQTAGYIKAGWSHPYLLSKIPKAKRQRICRAVSRRFFRRNFDQEFFDLRTWQLDSMQAQERAERANKRKAANDPKTMP